VVGGSGKLKIRLNSAQLELELGLSLATFVKFIKISRALNNIVIDL
jgi:hypothetical protein